MGNCLWFLFVLKVFPIGGSSMKVISENTELKEIFDNCVGYFNSRQTWMSSVQSKHFVQTQICIQSKLDLLSMSIPYFSLLCVS